MFHRRPESRPAVRRVATAFLLLSLAAALPGLAAGAAEPQQADRVAVGDTAIDFSLQSIDGETYRLSDLRGDKNAIVIFFRGSW